MSPYDVGFFDRTPFDREMSRLGMVKLHVQDHPGYKRKVENFIVQYTSYLPRVAFKQLKYGESELRPSKV